MTYPAFLALLACLACGARALTHHESVSPKVHHDYFDRFPVAVAPPHTRTVRALTDYGIALQKSSMDSDRQFAAQDVDPTVTGSRTYVGEHGVTTHHFVFPGSIAQAAFISDNTMVVLSGRNLFATRDHGRNWESWTDSAKYNGVLAGKVRHFWTQTDAISTDSLSHAARSEYGTGLCVVTDSSTYYVPVEIGSSASAPVELRVADSVALRRFASQLKPGSVAFDAVEFHPKRPRTHAFAFLRDPTCSPFQADPCRNFAFLTTNMKDFYLVPLYEPTVLMWENPVAPQRVNFSQPPVERERFETVGAKCYSASHFFIILVPQHSHFAPGTLFRVPLDTTAWESVDEASLRQSIVMVETNSYFVVAVDGFEYISGLDVNRNIPTMLVSNDNFRSVAKAVFPSDIFSTAAEGPETQYTVLDSTESVFINVYRGTQTKRQMWGHTYQSGARGLRYTLSLPYTRAAFGREGQMKVDFHRLSGLDGTLIANAVTNPQAVDCRNCVEASCEEKCHYASFISRDNGKTWQRLSAPHVESEEGSESPETPAPETFGVIDEKDGVVSLHLHGLTTQSAIRLPGILSSRHAPGLILAHGNVGPKLNVGSQRESADVYASYDGGDSWVLIAQGPHLYGETDLGGLLYLAPRRRVSADFHMNFSIDGGQTFRSTSILPPNGPAINFLWSGRPIHDPLLRVAMFMGVDESGRTHAVQIDFSGNTRRRCQHLHEPDTPDSDFETFTPHSYYSAFADQMCLLGRSMIYTRRKRGKTCWISPMGTSTTIDYSLPIKTTICSCTIDDFECDFGYKEAAGGQCANAGAPTLMDICKSHAEGHKWTNAFVDSHGRVRNTLGYRKMDGDSCVGGTTSQYLPTPAWIDCNPQSHSSVSWVTPVVIVAFLVVACVILFHVNPRCRHAVEAGASGIAPVVTTVTDHARSVATAAFGPRRPEYGALPSEDNTHFPESDHDDEGTAMHAQPPATQQSSAANVDPDDTDLEGGEQLTDV